MRFPPGTRLIERELCTLIGVSRTLIREALRELEGEGLVQLTSKGPIVAILTEADAHYIYDIRAALEGMAGRRCAEASTAQIVAALRKALRQVEVAYTDESTPPSEKLAAKSLFYDALVGGAGNPVLADMLRMLHGRINMLRARATPERAIQSLSDIRAIVRAIEERDPDESERRCVEHVRNASVVAYARFEAFNAESDIAVTEPA